MTDLRRRAGTGFALLLTAAMLLAVTAGLTGQGMPRVPGSAGNGLNAAVTIKTQRAADSIEGGIRGIDVSKYQGNINWKSVAADDVEFVFVRSSYGTTPDPKFVANCQGADQNGLYVGAYHFATFNTKSQMQKEARFFLQQLDRVNITYPVVLDLEGQSHTKMKKSTLTSLAKQFMDIVAAEGYTVLLYSNTNFIKNHLDLNNLGGYDLWIANYIEQPKSPAHICWQHTSYGSVKGISGRVDINIAYRDLSGNGGVKTASTTGPTLNVDKKVSDSIKATLNDRYGTKLSDQSSMSDINQAIARGIQKEINRQWGEEYVINGQLSAEQIKLISEVKFTSSTGGNITYLLQAKLFYKGYYTGTPSAQFDSKTQTSLKSFQERNSLNVTGNMSHATLHKLLK